jgi:predicted esterase
MHKCIITATLIGCIAPAMQGADPLDSLAFVHYDSSGNTLPYRLFLPPGYDEPGAEFPLMLFLHGAGERGDDNTAQVLSHIDGLIDATQSERFASFLLAPQAPAGGSWSNFGSADNLNISTELVTQVISLLESQYQIDPSRRYVTGLSMGGFGTFDLIAKRPDMFAAAAPMSGGGDSSRAADMADIPMWAFHGAADTTVHPSATRVVIQALVDIGSDPIYLETRGPHSIWGPIYEDATDELYPWMFEGAAPPLATLIYNSLTGNVKVDATMAPGGVIEHFRIATIEDLNLTGDIVIDGVTLQPVGTTRIIYDGRASGGFSRVADLGNIMPPGRDLIALAEGLREFWYLSPETGLTASDTRNFRLQIVVPEPSTLGLLASIGLLLLPMRHRHRGTPPTERS